FSSRYFLLLLSFPTRRSSDLFYYLPILSGDVFAIAILCAVLFGITQSAFVPIFAIFTALVPDHIGATLSSHNLAAGLSNFIAPLDRKSTRLNSSHVSISYAVF